MDDFVASLGAGGGQCPGVLVFHGGAGRGAHEEERARRLAELGYVALAPDLFGVRFESRARGVEVIGRLVDSPEVLRERVRGALDRLRAHPSVDASRCAAIGFCFGGLAALELARSGADVRSVVSFHGGLSTRAHARAGEVRASVLVCPGAEEPCVSPEHRRAFEEEMASAGADWQMHVYGGAEHGFTHRDAGAPGVKYDAAADARSWAAMRCLFEATFA